MPRVWLGVLLVWSVSWMAEAAEPAPAVDRADLAAFVDGFVEARMRAHHVAGVTVSVVHDGELIFAAGYGHDDVAAGRAVAPERTLFRPGSISKTFTWTAVMQLVEQGRLDLNADIRTYLPELAIADTFAEPITLAHLMAHTPGFEESVMGHLFVDQADRVQPLLDYLKTHQPARVRPPGVAGAYSNFGTAVAGLIVANVSGMSWEDYADRYLFGPLGMTRSTFREPWGAQRAEAPMPEALRQDVSRGYAHRGGSFRAGGFEYVGQIGPAGALATTATDMARWMLAHLNGGELGGARILAADTARRMHAQHWTPHPDMPGLAHGFIESSIHGYRAIGHGGGTVHFLSDMQLLPELGFGVFIATNTAGGGGQLIDGFVHALVARLFPAGPGWPAGPSDAGAVAPATDYAGSYLSTRRPYTTVERLFMTSGAMVTPAEGGALVVLSPMGESRLEPLGGDLFVTADRGERVRFVRDDAGAVTHMLPPMPVMVMERPGLRDDPRLLMGVLGGAAVVLLAAVVGAWLRRRRPPPQTTAERCAGVLIVVTAATWLTAYAVGLLGVAPLAEDFSQVFYGFPSAPFLAALWIALAAALLTVASVLLLYPVWRAGRWPRWRRWRHTGVVLAAVATLVVLHEFNAIGFRFIGS
jgi:CubicO group peptidase (beta-lactamase class C family)